MGDYFTTKRYLVSPLTGSTSRMLYGRQKPRAATPESDVLVSSGITLPQITRSYRTNGEDGLPAESPGSLIRANQEKFLRKYDSGHEFSTRKGIIELSHTNWFAGGVNGTWYRGPIIPTRPTWLSGSDPLSSVVIPSIDLSYGTKAIKVTQPTSPSVQLTRFLSELMIDLPRIPLQDVRLKVPKKSKTALKPFGGFLGGNYLNIAFGWMPTVSDVFSICQAIVKSHDIIEQYKRDSGLDHQVRRRFTFEETHTVLRSQTRTSAFCAPMSDTTPDYWRNLVPVPSDLRGTIADTETLNQKYWFSGAYSYILDPGSAWNERMGYYLSLAQKVLGLKLSIDVIYELAPWTWLADWFVNIGDVLSNVAAFQTDGLVLRYGYLMRESVYEVRSVHSGIPFLTGHTGFITSSHRVISKERVRATPYGFGLNPSSFTAAQWAILVALGMTNGNRKLL